MPLPASPRLGLTRPAGTDPFLRDTIVDDLDIIDEFPGVFVCTSTSRPAWGANQNGMLISETDTGRTRRWNGSAWTISEDYARINRASVTLNADLAANATATYALDTITTFRPCVLNVIILVKVRKTSANPQIITFHPWIDGSDAGYGWDSVAGFPDGVNGSTKSYTTVTTCFGSRSYTDLGQHNRALSVRVNVDNAASNPITLLGVKSMVFMSEA